MARFCPDCGIEHSPAHFQQKLESVLNDASHALLKNLAPITNHPLAQRFEERFWKAMIFCLRRIGVTRLAEDCSDHPVLRTRALAESAQRLGIKLQNVRTLGFPSNLFFARLGDREIFFEGLPRPENTPNALGWMDDKTKARTKLSTAGIPISRGGSATTLEEARALASTLQWPLIVKPHSNSGARHTSIGVRNDEELTQAFHKTKQVSWLAVIEEEIPGSVHRALVINGKLVSTIRLEYANVNGDGIHTIEELREQENTHPKRDGHYYFPLPSLDDPETQQWLERQRCTSNSVPVLGTTVRLASKHIRARGAALHEVSTTVHPETRELCERVASVVNDPLIGIDMILGDISKSWKEQPCGITELNSIPFIHIHSTPLYGTPVMVADSIWNMVFPELTARV